MSLCHVASLLYAFVVVVLFVLGFFQFVFFSFFFEDLKVIKVKNVLCARGFLRYYCTKIDQAG